MVLTRYVGSGIRDQKGGIWDYSPKIRNHKPWDRVQQYFRDKGSGCAIFWDQGPEFVMLLDSRIRNVGTKGDQR